MNASVLTETVDFDGDVLELAKCFIDQKHLFLFESSYRDPSRGRYSFIGFDPFDVISSRDGDFLSKLKSAHQRFQSSTSSALTPLSCGAVGYLSYDAGLKQEKINRRNKDNLNLPDGVFGLYDCILTVDHLENKLHIVSTKSRIDFVLERLENIKPSSEKRLPVKTETLAFQSNLSKDEYIKRVRKVLDYIAAGDIYQINLSQRFHAHFKDGAPDGLLIYEMLRNLSPAPFSGYFDAGDHQLLSSSPERFISLHNGVVQTRPMKGTRRRGSSAAADEANEKELCESAKDQAELLMITDLERNDLGRVCEYGSVKVSAMRNIEVYKNVFQATSTVEGKLRAGEDAFSLLRACFPSGSTTGCPKIRAMQIIDELEPSARGPYTGSMGYIGFDGSMDLNVLIRTLIIKDRDIYFHAGGGIVADSKPELEYEETLIKAEAMMKALEQAQSVNAEQHR